MTKQIFISHAWGNDEFNRDNHKRCIKLSDLLQKNGYTTWIDNNEMFGNIDSSIMKGINNCSVVLICLTEKYCNKINNAVNNQSPNDNCYKEWNYSLFKKKSIIPIIMENKMKEIFTTQDGVIQMYLSSTLFIDMSESFDEEFSLLCKTLKNLGIYNKEEKKFIKNKENNSFENLALIFSKAINNLSPRKLGQTSPKKKYKKQQIINNKILRQSSKKNIFQNKKLTTTIHI